MSTQERRASSSQSECESLTVGDPMSPNTLNPPSVCPLYLIFGVQTFDYAVVVRGLMLRFRKNYVQCDVKQM